MFIKTIALTGTALLAIGVSMPGLAQDVHQESRIIVIDRADLLTSSGRTKIEARIARAATQVCEPTYRRSVQFSSAASACRTKAMADARRQLDQRVAAANGDIRIAIVDSAAGSR
jgi:UrcA family protein